MSRSACFLSRGALGAASACGAAMVLAAAFMVQQFFDSRDLDGYYAISGQLILADGQLLPTHHTLKVSGGRFYAISRQGESLVETSGDVQYGFLGHYRLRVEDGDTHELNRLRDDELLFNMLYSRRPGSPIHLRRQGDCLYAQETRQSYCPDAP